MGVHTYTYIHTHQVWHMKEPYGYTYIYIHAYIHTYTSGVAHEGALWVFGGSAGSSRKNDLQRFDLSTRTWNAVESNVRMYVCMYVCMHACTRTWNAVESNVRMYVCMYVCMCARETGAQ
jgi:hypothetical protein